MAAGNLIYVGKSRLRRKFREKRIENKIKRHERRKAQRELRRTPSPQGDTVSTCSGCDDNNNNNKTGNKQDDQKSKDKPQHCCRFCDDQSSLDSFGLDSSSGSDSEDFVPLIDNLSLRPSYRMPFGPFKKKVCDEVTPGDELPQPGVTEPLMKQSEEPDSSADTVRRLQDQLAELQQAMEAKDREMTAKMNGSVANDIEMNDQEKTKDDLGISNPFEEDMKMENKADVTLVDEAEKATPESPLVKRKRLPESQPGGLLCCCSIM